MNMQLQIIGGWWLWWLFALWLGLSLFLRWEAGASKLWLGQWTGLEMARRLTPSLGLGKRYWRISLVVLGLLLAWLALARPQSSVGSAVLSDSPLDLALVVDVSRSMLAVDLPGGRLGRAQVLASRLVQARPGDRFALVVFAGEAFVELPLTRDRDILRRRIETLSPATMPVQGTSLEAALKVAAEALAAGPEDGRAVVLFSDGEELQGDSRAAAVKLGELQIPVFPVGLGQPGAVSLVPLEDGGFLRDYRGEWVTTGLDELLLRDLAALTGGRYLRGDNQAITLAALEQALAGLAVSRADGQPGIESPVELFQVPLLFAVLLLLTSFFIGDRKTRLGMVRQGLTVMVLLGVGGEFSFAVDQLSPEADFRTGRLTSGSRFESVGPSRGRGSSRAGLYYNLALRYQLSEEPERAASLYFQLISRFAEDDYLRSKSLWNLGVLVHTRARTLTRSDLPAAVDLLETARQYYLEALRGLGATDGLVENFALLLVEQGRFEQFAAATLQVDRMDDENGDLATWPEQAGKNGAAALTEDRQFEQEDAGPRIWSAGLAGEMAEWFRGDELLSDSETGPAWTGADPAGDPIAGAAGEEPDFSRIYEWLPELLERERNFRDLLKHQRLSGVKPPEQEW